MKKGSGNGLPPGLIYIQHTAGFIGKQAIHADTEQPRLISGGGITVQDDVGIGCMPVSMEVSFRYEGTDYTCVLLPEGGPK